MQWLIDIIKEWIIAQGYLTAGFVDRGDPAAADFLTAAFTADNAWHELDLSGIVPENAKAVLLYCYVSDNVISSQLRFRKAGNVNEFNMSSINTQVASVFRYADIVVPLPSNRKIEYKSDIVTWSYIRLVVKGWWL